VPALPAGEVQRIVQMMEQAGMTAKVSSIHVNGWFGAYDKLSMAHLYLRERCGLELEAEKERVTFAGDSPNDAPMFSYLPHSVGVANVRKFGLPASQAPGWVTTAAAGSGFAELAAAVLHARRGR
jgi:hydroxymethylpyrimidine pyrophosphatase-like HAD family hydrolase